MPPRPRPWDNTYWVHDLPVLAGEYPGDRDPGRARAKLASLADAGVRAIVDLTTAADQLVPYAPLLPQVARDSGVHLAHLVHPVADLEPPTPAQMRRILDHILEHTAHGEAVYVHCLGGVGRAGTVVGCLLVERGLDPARALEEVDALFATTAKRPHHPRSPQTSAQCDFVHDWPALRAQLDEPLAVRLVPARLVAAHPPRFVNGHKRALVERAFAQAPQASDPVLHVSRWPAAPVPEAFPDGTPELEMRAGFFRYDPADARPGEVHWHQNFADPELFGFYSGNLLAQDEMQVLEHPVLGAVREWLRATGLPARTVEGRDPTPVLVAGAERRLAVPFEHHDEHGIRWPLYGNAFARAPEAVVLAAVRPVRPPTTSNIVAISAPAGGTGFYQRTDLEAILRTAWSGYRAAVRCTRDLHGDGRVAVLHTGWWGCGAFGGDRELMATLQLLAARLAGIARVVFHYGHDGGGHAWALEELWRRLALDRRAVTAVLQELAARGYRWGAGDGN